MQIFDWSRFTLFLYILMRMSGFVLFNPLFGRRSVPGIVKSGISLVLAITVYYVTPGGVAVPDSILEFSLHILLELGLGFTVGFIMHLFFSIPTTAGFEIDTQMGLSMAATYDASSGINSSVTSTLFNILMVLLFFTANGHYTLFRILLASGQAVPFGAAGLNDQVVEAVVELFVECMLLALKLSLPILAAELLGQAGMGILMKAIPQINVFSINIELKVLIGLILVMLLISPFSEFLLGAEREMLSGIQQILQLMG